MAGSRCKREVMQHRLQIGVSAGFNEMLGRIRAEYQKVVVRSDQLGREKKSLSRLAVIMAIHEEAYRTQATAPEEFLRQTYSYENSVNALDRLTAELRIQVLEFEILCRHHLPARPLVPSDYYGCPMEDSAFMRQDQDSTLLVQPFAKPSR